MHGNKAAAAQRNGLLSAKSIRINFIMLSWFDCRLPNRVTMMRTVSADNVSNSVPGFITDGASSSALLQQVARVTHKCWG